MKKLIIIGFAFLFSAYADDTAIKRVAVGEGLSKSSAVQQALIEAVKQISGVSIAEQKIVQDTLAESTVITNGVEDNLSIINENSLTKVQQATKGRIKSYSILNSNKVGNRWEVEVEVIISKYKTPGHQPSSRRSIAVMPIRKGVGVSNDAVDRINQSLVTNLTQARKFSVMDRDYYSEYLQEKNMVLSADMNQETLMRLGEVLGVDYMLLGTLREYSEKEKVTHIKAIGQDIVDVQQNIRFEYRIIVMATRQIKWSDTIDLEMKNQKQSIIDIASHQFIKDIMDNIFPMTVVHTAGTQVIFNEGGKRINKGDVFDIYLKGQVIKDPYTGESLGSTEVQTGTVIITKVNAKLSYGELIDGSAQVKSIARLKDKTQAQKQVKTAVETQIEKEPVKKEYDGVSLPFD